MFPDPPPPPAAFARTKAMGVIINLLMDIHLTHILTSRLVGEPILRPGFSKRNLGTKKKFRSVCI